MRESEASLHNASCLVKSQANAQATSLARELRVHKILCLLRNGSCPSGGEQKAPAQAERGQSALGAKALSSVAKNPDRVTDAVATSDPCVHILLWCLVVMMATLNSNGFVVPTREILKLPGGSNRAHW